MPEMLTWLRRQAREANVSVNSRALAKELLVQSRIPTAPSRMKPGFFLIGAMKAGTTSLFNNLVPHPVIAEPISKEIRYFDFHFHRGERWYRAHFPRESGARRRGETITGEASPSYLFEPYAPGRISRFAPGGKIIVLLRNPADRAYSHYQHAVRYWGETRSFEDAVRNEEGWIEAEQKRHLEDPDFMGLRRIQHSYLARGRYLEQLRWWEAEFPRDRMLILRAEDYFERPEVVFPEVLRFLELPEWRPAEFQRLNMAKYEKLNPDLRVWMNEYFAESNRALEEYLGWSRGWTSR